MTDIGKPEHETQNRVIALFNVDMISSLNPISFSMDWNVPPDCALAVCLFDECRERLMPHTPQHSQVRTGC